MLDPVFIVFLVLFSSTIGLDTWSLVAGAVEILELSPRVTAASPIVPCVEDCFWWVPVPNDFCEDGFTIGFSSLDCEVRGGAALGGDIAGRVSFGGAVIILGEGVLARALPYLNR